ncbi:MAG: SDR family oxidoreductase [Nostoc sp.]|uniref:SDR family oxidoreductase n=1 Tax=Nostoc sp. TaxID=1180 RepID=UPI002FF62215
MARRRNGKKPEINRTLASQTVLGGVGLPEDVGGVVALLLSDEMRWVNGQRIEVKGGTYL